MEKSNFSSNVPLLVVVKGSHAGRRDDRIGSPEARPRDHRGALVPEIEIGPEVLRIAPSDRPIVYPQPLHELRRRPLLPYPSGSSLTIP